MKRLMGQEGIRISARMGFLVDCLVLSVPALGAETFTLSNLRLDPVPVEAYGQVRIRVDYSGAQVPLARLWTRLGRDGHQVEPVAYEIRKDDGPAPAGTVGRSFEMGEPGPRHLTVVAEDARGVKSAPLELRFEAMEPPQGYEELTYLSEGLKIKAYLYRPRGQGPFPAVIYSHGSRTRAELQEPGRYKWLAYRLARQGYLVLVAERRGYGGSEGQGVIGGEGLNTVRWGLPGEIKDVLAAVAFLAERPDTDANRIALVGKSLGGLVSLLAAAEQPRIRAVVSLAGGVWVWGAHGESGNALRDGNRPRCGPKDQGRHAAPPRAERSDSPARRVTRNPPGPPGARGDGHPQGLSAVHGGRKRRRGTSALRPSGWFGHILEGLHRFSGERARAIGAPVWMPFRPSSETFGPALRPASSVPLFVRHLRSRSSSGICDRRPPPDHPALNRGPRPRLDVRRVPHLKWRRIVLTLSGLRG